MKKTLPIILGLTLAVLGAVKLLPVAVAQADSTVVVTAPVLANNLADVLAHPSAWFFYNDETDVIDNSLGSFVTGPSTPPLGTGSIQMSVTGTQRRNIATYQFSGTKLADITALKFSTYNPSAGNGGSANRSAYLNFNIDFNNSDTWQGRLVYVPSVNGSVTQDTWKEWDAQGASGSAMWTWSKFAANGNKWPDNNPNPNRSWSEIVAAFPDIRIRVTDSWLGLRVGEPYADGYTENIDSFTFGTASGVTHTDFEVYVPASTPVITVPTNGASVTTSALTKVEWDDSTPGTYGPVEYQYEAFSDAGYTNSLYLSGWLAASEIPTPGTPPGTYYVRVKARDSVGTETAWSNGAATPYTFTVTADPVLVGPPTTKDECRHDGWKTFNNPTFKNQGKCIDYVEKHAHKISGEVSYWAYGLRRAAEFEMNTAEGKGEFEYADANHNRYKVRVSAIKVDGNLGYFAGQVTKASNPAWVGQWLFAKVQDNGKHTPDLIWGSFTDMATAQAGVAAMSNPADGPFTIIKGNLKVK